MHTHTAPRERAAGERSDMRSAERSAVRSMEQAT